MTTQHICLDALIGTPYSFFFNLTFYQDDYLALCIIVRDFTGCLLFSSIEYINENALTKKEKVPGLDRHLGRRLLRNRDFSGGAKSVWSLEF